MFGIPSDAKIRTRHLFFSEAMNPPSDESRSSVGLLSSIPCPAASFFSGGDSFSEAGSTGNRLSGAPEQRTYSRRTHLFSVSNFTPHALGYRLRLFYVSNGELLLKNTALPTIPLNSGPPRRHFLRPWSNRIRFRL